MKNKFDIFKLKGRLSWIRDLMQEHHVHPKLLFILLEILSTIWFLFRVIPKPSRASYPCMQAAAPFMSGFVLYLLSLGGVTLFLRKAWRNILNAKYLAAVTFFFIALSTSVITLIHGNQLIYARNKSLTLIEEQANQPIGKALGINPGRVVWAWNKEATNEKCTNNFQAKDWYFKSENTNAEEVSKMVRESVCKLCGKSTIPESWNELFSYHNKKKHHTNKGYTKGEKIFIKINQGTARWLLSQENKDNGYYYPSILNPDGEQQEANFGTTETEPYVVLELLRELVNEMGIAQADIAVGDPMSDIYGYNYDLWFKEFPEVNYIDKYSSMHGRTLIHATSNDLVYYSDKSPKDKLFDVIEKADYLINVANLKPHSRAGISLCAKNHFGSIASPTAEHLHYSLLSPSGRVGVSSKDAYHKYRVLVDLMGSKYLGQNTMLYVVDGLYGGGASEIKKPVKYLMSPFNSDWCNSLFVSQDEVALESVCFDFLRTEWNGINQHDAVNNTPETNPNMAGVDDYLHQAADSSNWPAGIIYDPDNSGNPISSLGTHEHWKDAESKQYSRNLGFDKGIELVSIPDTLVKNQVKADATKTVSATLNTGLGAKTFYSALVDNDNTKWFLTELGIVSYDGKSWILHNKNRKVPSKELKNIVYDTSPYGSELWIASSLGATVASFPIDARTGATTYYTGNSSILSNNVLSVAIGKSTLRWFGTDKGISAFYDNKWLTPSYQRTYSEDLFEVSPITVMATNRSGDTLYVGTKGAGVARVFRNEIDGISGASEYAQWGPIRMPSDNVYSICITPDGTQWFGTDMGVARHIGFKTKENWSEFNVSSGLVNNFVQVIAQDKKGKIWFGTKGGVSVLDGTKWASFTIENGLCSNNIMCIVADKNGTVWIGTDNGVMSYESGKFVSHK